MEDAPNCSIGIGMDMKKSYFQPSLQRTPHANTANNSIVWWVTQLRSHVPWKFLCLSWIFCLFLKNLTWVSVTETTPPSSAVCFQIERTWPHNTWVLVQQIQDKLGRKLTWPWTHCSSITTVPMAVWFKATFTVPFTALLL